MPAFSIAHRPIGLDSPPFVIAEMSGNHNQSLDRALAIVDAAAGPAPTPSRSRTYTADTMTLDIAGGDFVINDPNSLWAGRSLHQLYRRGPHPLGLARPDFRAGPPPRLIPFSTPSDETAVEFLETLDVPLLQDRLLQK